MSFFGLYGMNKKGIIDLGAVLTEILPEIILHYTELKKNTYIYREPRT
jgi:hypothetical protein